MVESNSKTILLVEDEALIAMMEKKQLQSDGYRVIMAGSGENAVKIACEEFEPVDLVLMDINLGRGMNGVEAAQNILRQRDIPILFLSSHTDPQIVRLTEAITSYGYVVKNSGDTVLLASIRMAFKLHEANRRVREEEERYRTTFDSIGEGIIAVDASGRITRINPEAERLTGWSSQEAANLPLEQVFHIIHEETRLEVDHPVSVVLRKGAAVELTNHTILIAKDGTECAIATSGAPIHNDQGNITGVVLVFRDQTRERAAQDTIIAQYRSLFENNRSTMLLVDPMTGSIVDANIAAAQYYGWSRSELMRMNISEINTLSREEVWQEMMAARETRRNHFLFQHRLKDGSIRDVEVYSSPIQIGERSLLYSTIYDITDRKRTECALQESEQKYHTAFHLNPVSMTLTTLKDGRFLDVNEETERITGRTREELIGKSSLELNIWVDPSERDTVTQEIEKNGRVRNFEFKMRAKSGKIRHLLWSVEMVTIGDEPCMLGAAQDISERLLGEIAMQENPDNLSKAFHFNPISMTLSVIDEGRFLDVNAEFLRLIEYTREELIGKNVYDLNIWVHPEHRKQIITEVKEVGQVRNIEIEMRAKSGKIRHLLWSSERLEIGGELCMLGAAQDITERKQVEEMIRALLREKELLLKEVHHRVKNNMSTIASLLQIQLDMHSEETVKVALLEAASRVQSMMTLYDQLYRSRLFDAVSLKTYIPMLLNEIIVIFSVRGKITLQTDIEDILIPPSQLSPLGIILNELTSNTIKHAFPGKTDGAIYVSAARKGSRVTLIYEDNGIGLHNQLDLEESDGFGMQLIQMLITQIKGTVRIEPANGARFVIEFDAET